MSRTETHYIEICKKQLEEKFSFGNGYGYTQKDLELLSNYIEREKGVYISLSTLKRLWKNDFKHGPQLATLNALVGVLDYDDWQHFKLANKNTEVPKSRRWPSDTKRSERHRFGNSKMVLLLALPILVVLALLAVKSSEPPPSGISVNGTVRFKVDKTLFKGVPNTAIFKYDVSKVRADSFFVQQSWNRWRREEIDPKGSVYTSIYYESGYHRARLIANDSVVAMQPVHILSDGWEPHMYYAESDERFIDFKGESFISNGTLNFPKELLLQKKLDTVKGFMTRISNSQVFGLSSNNFKFYTRVKSDAMATTNCPWLNVYIITEKHIFYVDLVRKGCEIFGAYKMGEIIRNGKNNDLSLLGQDLYEWQEIGINVKDKHAEITINGQSAYTETFKEDFGNIMGLTYIFHGTGAIDYVKLSDGSGKTIFEDEFNR